MITPESLFPPSLLIGIPVAFMALVLPLANLLGIILIYNRLKRLEELLRERGKR